MGLQDFMTVFSNLDPSCKGFVTLHQVLEFCQSIYHSSISVEQIEHAITQICGSTSSGRVSRQQFIAVLEEIERRRSVEEQAYWDFQALDYKGTNRISLKDALMMFREFHGDRFSLYTWKEFLQSRDDPDEQVYFDEIRLWLCNYPSGEPASKDQITQEEEQLIKRQSRHQSDRVNKLKQIQDDKEEIQEYLDNAQYNAQRRRNKWDKQGLEAMLFDDGLEADDDTTSTKPKDTITMSDVNDAMTQKYDKLKSKLLWEMAKMSSAMESDRQEIFQQLCREEKQYSREGSLQDRIGGLSGSRLDLIATLTGLMGEVRSHDLKRREQAEKKRETLGQQGMKEHDINKAIQTEYQGVISGDTTCGATLIHLIERFKLEKEETMMVVKSRASMSSVALENEYYRLLRQHLLLTDEWGFPALAMAVGLAERPQQYRSTKGNDWDRNRSEQLSQIQLEDRKGRKLQHTPADLVDTNKLDDLGLTDLKQHLIKEIVQKHFYEREAMINMLQGRESEQQKKKAHQMSSQERKKRLKVLRNQQISWSQSNSDDTKNLHQILTEAVALYCEVRREELLPTANIVTDNVVSECVLADLIQRQEVEYEASLEQFVSKQVKSDVVFLIKKENKMRIKEHFDNISFVALGTIEISAEDKDYIDALDVKYDTLRKNILRMGLEYKMGTEWKQLNEKERKKYIKEKEKEERKLRGLGQLQDMESLIGPKSKALPSLRQLIGEEKTEYEKRLQEQRKTGQNQDEPPADKFPHMNVLADLVPRYDNEQESLLIWLNSTSTKQLPVKTQRLKIVLLKLETFCAQLENDFEVSALGVGLIERLIAALQNRHPRDQSRQYDLAMRRTRLRLANLQQKEPTKKKEQSFTPEKGDLTGWQTAYLYEVMKRHNDEREQLLKYLQDESITELMEAASEMSADERKSRLAELQTKRRKLDLANSGDKEDYISILEEAVAISAISRKSGRTSMEEVTVTTLRDLQDRQDRELAKLLQNIENVTEEQLENRLEEEKDARQQGIVHNVFDILTQTDDTVKEDELTMALQEKYSRLQDSLLSECLCQSCGKESWDKIAEKDKLLKLANLKEQVKDLIQKGDHVGLKGLVDVIALEKSVRALMGIHRHQFLQKVLGDDLINEEEITDKMNPILEIHHRNQEEVDLLLQMIKGSGSMFIDEAEQQIHLIRLKREVFIGSHFDFRFATVAMVMGLAERQQVIGKPRLVDDRQRIEMVAIATMQSFMQGRLLKKKDVRDEVMRGPGKHVMMESAIILLDRSHQDEQQYLLLLLTAPQKSDVVMEIQSWSQQQRKDQLWKLHSQRQEILAVPNSREFNTIYSEGLIIKKEIYRHRLNNEQKEEVDDEVLHKMLLADLLSQQNCDAEKVLQSLMEEGQDFIKLQMKIIEEKRNEVRENISIVLLTSETCDSSSNEETELLEALDGKYDALRDKLLAEVLMRQLGETEWNRLSELERQKKLAELKLKERQLRRDGKYDEVANIIGAALEDQETLDRLFGDSKEEQERKMKERLHRRKQRLASGMSEQECDELEAEEIKQEEEEEKKKRRNILLDLDKRCEQEKEELMRRLREQKDRVSLERQRQLELMKLKHDEKKARREEKFNSAALVIGRAKDEQKRLEQNQEDERQRQERLAKERLEAARKRRGKKLTPELETVTDMEDKSSLQESVGELIDKRHREERDLLIQLLDDATIDPNRQSVAAMTEEERQENLERIRQMRSNWRSKDERNKQDQTDLLKEAAVYLLESKLHQLRTEGLDVSDDKVKVQIVTDLEEKQNEQKLVSKEATDENVKVQVLSDLQEIQDGESKYLLTDLYDKDLRTLQQMVKLHRKTLDNGNHDNVSSVVLGDDDVTTTSDDSDVTEDQIKKAVEQKYDILRGKLLEATLIMQVGENEWSKLSEKERQKRLIELKMKEKKLRQEGKNDEATALFENLVESDEFALENLFGEEEIDEEQKAREREQRKKELQKEREAQGLPIDDAEIDKLLDEEETEAKRQKRRNVLDGLQMMLEDEKAALLRQLKEQVSGIDQERQRQLALVKLKMDKKKMEREEKYDSAALVLKLAKEADEKRTQNITADRERQKALAKERLEALRRKKQQKNKQDNLEQRLKEENENNKLLDAEMSSDVTRIQAAILDTIDKTHTEERELLMELVNMALQNKSLGKTAKDMQQEELKTELSKLEQDHSKWKKKSQQIAMSIDDSFITQKEEDKHLEDVANNRKNQTKLLSEALVYRMELEERSLKTLKPELSSEQIKEELSVILLADLQDQQERDSTAVQNIIQKQQSAEDLKNLKKMQRLSEREGWFNNLSKTLFQLSSQDDDDDSDESTQEAIEKRKQVLEKEYKEEREAKIQEAMRAKMAGEEIDIQAELKQLEKEQQAKRKALDEELAKQRQALKDKINAKKRKGQEKEEEEIEAYHLLMLQQSQAEKSKEAVDGEKSRQSSKLQDKIRLRKEERMRLKKEAGMIVSEEESNSRPSTVDSKGPPLFNREKTVVNVDITEDQKQAVFNKLVREQTSLHDKIKQQQEQQQEMLKRRLDKSRGRKEMQAKEIMDMSERQKKEYHKTKTEERDRQLQQMQQRISKHRARSRSPNNMGASPIPEDQLSDSDY
ncbi:trichohyalin-like isoform X2 [Mytilus californianus]|uniref:trichohyalin-like isoform X2 n=1 Tax=Mytilus californianus TaxID=6549 RepID=UPI002245C6C2|nr:trichohyalin-like isoform X2 [Mytilus californianus]